MSGTILVTGGTGRLGSLVVDRLRHQGDDVRVMSRTASPAGDGPARVVGDLAANRGVTAALTGVTTVVHCATSQRGEMGMATNLLAAAREAGVAHLVYCSIVGVDRIPLGYYRTKHAVEELLLKSGLGVTVQRSTQFHQLLRQGFEAMRFLPVMPLPTDLKMQPIDAGEAADRLIELCRTGPAGRVPDIGGPQVEGFADLARSYLATTGRRRPIVPLPLAGKTVAAYRRGAHLAPQGSAGRVTFEEYLSRSS